MELAHASDLSKRSMSQASIPGMHSRAAAAHGGRTALSKTSRPTERRIHAVCLAHAGVLDSYAWLSAHLRQQPPQPQCTDQKGTDPAGLDFS